MTEQEAIKDIKRQLFEINSEDADITLSTESLKMAIKALEKQIAKKPLGTTMAKDKDTSVGSIGRCPCCDGIVAEDMLWCDDCGQKLDWQALAEMQKG